MKLRAMHGLLLVVLCVVTTRASEPPNRPGWLGMAFTYHRGAESPTVAWLQIRHVLAGGPAQAAGLQPQDLIVSIDGRTVRFQDTREALRAFTRLVPGDTLVLGLIRGGKRRTVKVTASVIPEAYYDRWKQNEELAAQSDAH